MFLLNICLILVLAKFSNCDVNSKLELKTKVLKQSDLSNVHLKNDFNENKSSESLSTFQDISGTNLTTGTTYCIKSSLGNFLKWDGNTDAIRYGLIRDSKDDCLTNDLYHFEFEVADSQIRLKNIRTDNYISIYSSYIFLSTSSYSSSYNDKIRLITRANGLLSIQFYSTSYYLSNTFNFYSTWGINYNVYALSSASAELSFIQVKPDKSNASLSLRISSFKYDIPNEDVIQDCISKVNLISPTVVNNTSPSTITHEILNEEVVEERLCWGFNQSFSIFENVLINKGLPQILKRNPKFKLMKEIFPLKKRLFDVNQNCYLYENIYKVKKSVNIQQNSAVRIEAILNTVENLVIEFTAKGEITGNNTSGFLTGSQIATIVENSNLNFSEILENSVIVLISGKVEVNFGLDNYFNVININAIEYDEKENFV